METFIILLLTTLADRAVHPTSIHSEYVSVKQLSSGINTEFIMLAEQWKPIKSYEGYYEISNFGEVRGLEREISRGKQKIIVKPHMLTRVKNDRGYYTVSLSKKSIPRRTYLIHQLVWDNWGNKKRDKKNLWVDHIDNNSLNNRIDNLQLLTPRENHNKGVLANKKDGLPLGVQYDKTRKKYLSEIKFFIGRFDNPQDASNAYWKVRNVLDNFKLLKGEQHDFRNSN